MSFRLLTLARIIGRTFNRGFATTDDTQIAAIIDIIKQGFKAEVAAEKDELARSTEPHWKPAGNGARRIALLELAIERQFEIWGGEHAFEVIEGVFKRIVKQRTH